MTGIGHVVLDRDGVLDVEPAEGWLDDPAAWRWERGALAGLARLAAAGVRVSVATNQSGIGRGVVAAEAVEVLHGWLADELRGRGIDLVGIFCCPHAPDDGCRCRKPAPGLVDDAVAASGVDRSRTAMVGDSPRDARAALAAGVRPVLVRTGKGGERPPGDLAEVARVDDLADAATLLLGPVGPDDQRSLR